MRREGRSAGGYRLGFQSQKTLRRVLPEKGKPAISVQEFPTAPEASQALLSKNINAQLEIAPAAQIIVEKSRGRPAISSNRLVYPLPLGIYVAKGNTELAEAIKSTLATLKANGKYDAIIKKYSLESIN